MTPTYPFPINPGADVNAAPPDFITWCPQDADVTLVGQKTNSYVIQGAQGAWVVDPSASKAEAIGELLTAAQGKVAGIWLTHAHPDHIAGIAPLAAQTGAPVYAHPRSWESLTGDFERISVQEGTRIGEWQVYEVPGHRYDHIAFVHTPSRVAVVGDLVAGAGSIIVDPHDGDLFDYLASLRRLRDEIAPSLLLPGHGPLGAEPQQLLTHFINHRLKREQLVVDALTYSPQPLAAILAVAYADTPAYLHPLAERALLAHLLKLEREGRATQTGAQWQRGAVSVEG